MRNLAYDGQARELRRYGCFLTWIARLLRSNHQDLHVDDELLP